MKNFKELLIENKIPDKWKKQAKKLHDILFKKVLNDVKSEWKDIQKNGMKDEVEYILLDWEDYAYTVADDIFADQVIYDLYNTPGGADFLDKMGWDYKNKLKKILDPIEKEFKELRKNL